MDIWEVLESEQKQLVLVGASSLGLREVYHTNELMVPLKADWTCILRRIAVLCYSEESFNECDFNKRLVYLKLLSILVDDRCA